MGSLSPFFIAETFKEALRWVISLFELAKCVICDQSHAAGREQYEDNMRTLLTTNDPRFKRLEGLHRPVPVDMILPLEGCLPVAQVSQPHCRGMLAEVISEPE